MTQLIMRAIVAGGVAFFVVILLFGMGADGASPAVIGGAVGGAVGATIKTNLAKRKKVVPYEKPPER